jgi:DNA-binding transcriptional LysR family regulator
LQLMELRERQLDVMVVDVRRLVASPDLNITHTVEMRAGFVCRQGHPILSRHPDGVPFESVLDYPVASSPLSQEVARIMVEHYGPRANPAQMTSLECEDIASLIDTVSQTDAIYLGILGAARQGLANGTLQELSMSPPFRSGARLAIVTLVGRTELPVMQVFREFVVSRLVDHPAV